MGYILRHLPHFILTLAGLVAVVATAYSYSRRPSFQRSWKRALLALCTLASCALLVSQFVLRVARFAGVLGPTMQQWCVSAAFMVLLVVAGLAVGNLLAGKFPRTNLNPGRRHFLRVARGTLIAAPAAAAGYGFFIQRTDLRVREISLPIKGLAQELDGFRMVQLSDIHLSPFLSENDLERAVAIANELKPHLALSTGDLITTHIDPLDVALRNVARIRSDLGTLGCHGNHEIYAQAQDYATEQGQRLGMRFLRSESQEVKYKGRSLNFVGVDYQESGKPYLRGIRSLIRPGMPNILLSHNPDVFPVAAGMGFDATISGHTHGGQINVEILHQNMSVARFYTPYVYGLYQRGNSSIYVTRGIGTVGLPVRLGAPPEITCIRLCAT